LRGRGEEEEEEEEEEEGGMRVYGYRYITGGRGGARGTSVCVQKGEKEGHILYLWVFAATVLSRRRLAAEELTDVLPPCPPPPPCPCPPPLSVPARSTRRERRSVSLPPPAGRLSPFPSGESAARDAQPAAGPCVISGAIPYSVPAMICFEARSALDILYRCARLSHIYI